MNTNLNHLQDHEISAAFKDFLYMVAKMRAAQTEWNKHYGYVLKQAKDEWEKKVDSFLSEFGNAKPVRPTNAPKHLEEDPDLYFAGGEY